MSPAALRVCLAFASVALAVAFGHLLVALTSAATRRAGWTRLGARTRASLLVQARLAPLTMALVLVPLVQLAFWHFEAVQPVERTGPVLPLLGAIGAGLLAMAIGRGWRSLAATLRVARAWRGVGERTAIIGWPGQAWIVRTPFPVVAVVGVGRANLYVSADVVGACNLAEIAAIAAHERAHVAGGDNLTRVLFALGPVTGPAAARLERQWAATAEEIADLHARAAGEGVTLAQALAKVARLAVGTTALPPLPMSALIGGDSLERRVRRLLEPAQPPGVTLRGWPAVAVVPVAIAAAIWGLPLVYAAAEYVVKFGG